MVLNLLIGGKMSDFETIFSVIVMGALIIALIGVFVASSLEKDKKSLKDSFNKKLEELACLMKEK
jgi:hypothetical protein